MRVILLGFGFVMLTILVVLFTPHVGPSRQGYCCSVDLSEAI
jgi:hypothetical protein